MPRQRFTGQERDGEAGLDYFNARFLEVRTGRFSRPDPLAPGVTLDPQQWNRYAYARNNPLKLVDPTGMEENSPFGEEPGERAWDDMTGYIPGWIPSIFPSRMRTLAAAGISWDALTFDAGGGGGFAVHSRANQKPSVETSVSLNAVRNALNLSPDQQLTFQAVVYAEMGPGTVNQFAAMISVAVNRARLTGATIDDVLNPNDYQGMTTRAFASYMEGRAPESPVAKVQAAFEWVMTLGPTTDALLFHTGTQPTIKGLGSAVPAADPWIIPGENGVHLYLYVPAAGTTIVIRK